jgi:hypothetical protein
VRYLRFDAGFTSLFCPSTGDRGTQVLFPKERIMGTSTKGATLQ